MGNIAERFARRQQPGFELIKNIVRAASGFEQSDKAAEELYKLLDGQLQLRSADAFHELVVQIRDEVRPRQDSEAVFEAVSSTVEDLCQVALDNNGPSRYLVALPVILEHARLAWELSITPSQAQAIEDILKAKGLVCENSSLSIYPQLISTQQAHGLSDGDIYRLTRTLAVETFPHWSTVIPEAGQRSSNGHDSPEIKVSAGLLVFVVSTEDGDPFPLASSFEHELEQQDWDRESTDESPEVQAALADRNEMLTQVSKLLAAPLGAVSLQLIAEPNDWYQAVSELSQVERSVSVQCRLKGMAAGVGITDFQNICVGDLEVLETEEAIQIAIHRTDNLSQIGLLVWEGQPDESADQCIDALMQWLTTAQLQHIRDVKTLSSGFKKLRSTPPGSILH